MEKRKNNKHSIPYEQGNHAFVSLIADTFGLLSEDFIRFVWMMANSATANFRQSQSSSFSAMPDKPSNTFEAQRGVFFSRMRVQLGAALAKAAAARMVRDGVEDGLPLRVVWERKMGGQVAPLPDLPLYHSPS